MKSPNLPNNLPRGLNTQVQGRPVNNNTGRQQSAATSTAISVINSGGSGATYLLLTGGTMDGAIQLADGSATEPSLYFGTDKGWFNDSANSGIGLTFGTVQSGFWNPTVWRLNSDTSADIISSRFSGNTDPPTFSGYKARGTIAAPTQALAGDISVDFIGWSYDNGGTPAPRRNGSVQFIVVSNTTTTNSEGRCVINTTPNASVTPSENARFDQSTGFSLFGANVVIDQNRDHLLRSYVIGSIPAQTAGKISAVSTLGGGPGVVELDGTKIHRLDGGGLEVQTTSTGAQSLTWLTNAKYQYYDTALTGVVTVTLQGTDSTGATVENGARFRIIRGPNATGAFNLDVVGATTKTLAAASLWVDFVYLSGTGWINVGTGAL